MPNSYKMICIDLDGTLLDSRQRISTTNKLAIKKALDHGLEVIIVSGRPNCFTKRIMGQIDHRLGHITFNGAYYRCAGKTRIIPIDHEIVKELARLGRKYNIRTYFKNKNLCLCTKSSADFMDYDLYKMQNEPSDRMDIYYYVDAITYFEENDTDILKIMAADNNLYGMKYFADEVEKLDHIHLYRYDDYFELSSDQTNKGMAITMLSQDLGIQKAEIASLGDSFNDVPMFEASGLAIAMGNASDAIKQQSDIVTKTNDENGVAYAIENYILP